MSLSARTAKSHVAPSNTAISGQAIPRSRHRRSPEDSFINTTSNDDGFSISAFGDLSMSEAYNVAAPTTGEYPLKLKRTRPPKPRKMQLARDRKDESTSTLLQHLCSPSLNYPLSPASDFKRFVEGLQSAKAASPFKAESSPSGKKAHN